MLDNNTYKFDTSDASNVGHQLALSQGVTNATAREAGTLGTAGSYWELTLQSVSASATTGIYQCVAHGRNMSEPGLLNFASGAVGQSGLGMTLTVVVSGGQVTSATILSQASNTCLLYTSPSPRD